jgi:hypothetical protein
MKEIYNKNRKIKEKRIADKVKNRKRKKFMTIYMESLKREKQSIQERRIERNKEKKRKRNKEKKRKRNKEKKRKNK